MIESAQEFLRLTTSEVRDEYLRAVHEEAPLSVWQEVISTMPHMKEWVVLNKNVPIQILEILAYDTDIRVRFAVAMKRKLPDSLQLVLARDSDEAVRDRIVYNAKVKKSVLEILAIDVEPGIRERALDRLKRGDYVV